MRTSSFVISDADTGLSISLKFPNGAVEPVVFTTGSPLKERPMEITINIHGEKEWRKDTFEAT